MALGGWATTAQTRSQGLRRSRSGGGKMNPSPEICCCLFRHSALETITGTWVTDKGDVRRLLLFYFLFSHLAVSNEASARQVRSEPSARLVYCPTYVRIFINQEHVEAHAKVAAALKKCLGKLTDVKTTMKGSLLNRALTSSAGKSTCKLL